MHRYKEKPGGHVLEQRNRFHRARHKPIKGRHKMTLWRELMEAMRSALTFPWESPQGLSLT